MSSLERRPQSPPPVRSSTRKALILVACGAAFVVVLLVIVWSLERGAPRRTEPSPDVIELATPGALTAAELRAAARGDEAIGTVAGGWIQVADAAGALSQQYRFDELDPSPEGFGSGWLDMIGPEFEVYGSGGRVLTLRGDRVVAYRPNTLIESGTLSGNVLIHVYEGVSTRPFDPSRHRPSLEISTTEARFDNLVGELRCDDAIHLETRGGEFDGSELRLLFNDEAERIELLRIGQVDRIRLAEGAGEAPESAPATVPSRPDDARPRPVAPRAGAKEENADVLFYRLTLHDDVRINQGTGTSARTATGDALIVTFTMKSEGFDAEFRPAPAAAPPASTTGLSIPEMIVAAAIAASAPAIAAPAPAIAAPAPAIAALAPAIAPRARASAAPASATRISAGLAPPASDSDTIIQCRGALTVEPITDPAQRLASARDVRLDLIGEPVLLRDLGARAEARGAFLRYEGAHRRIEIHGSGSHPFRLDSPQLVANGELFWLRDRDGAAGFDGPGSLSLRRGGEEALSIAWSGDVELRFDRARDASSLGALREATFRGDVDVRGEGLALGARADEPGDVNAGSDAPAQRPGRLAAGELHVTLVHAGEDDVALERLEATHDVHATDEAQAIWTESLRVDFTPPAGHAGRTEVATARAEGGVELHLPGGERALATTLDIDATARTAAIEGDNVTFVDGENVLDRCRRIEIDEVSGRSVLSGPGRFRRFGELLVPEGQIRLDRERLANLPEEGSELTIAWLDGGEIAREADGAGHTADAAPREDGRWTARFMGGVEIASPELRLSHAQSITAQFDSGAGGARSLRSFEALGDELHAHSVGDPGAIACRRLRVELASNERGETVPERLEASGAVHITDEAQHLWAERVTATFIERSPVAAGSQQGEPDGFAHARADLDSVIAEEAVQLRLDDGERVFADRLEADAGANTAELTGARILIVARDFVLDRATHVELDRASGAYEARGPGAFLAFDEAVPIPDVDRVIDLPAIPANPVLHAAWTTSATYRTGTPGSPLAAHDTLVLAGNVHAESRPSALEHNTVDAERLLLEFAPSGDPVEGSSPSDVRRREQQFARMIAHGGEPGGGAGASEAARLESRTWRAEDRGGLPRVFYVSGDSVEYDQVASAAHVVGRGELLMRDEWIDAGEGVLADPAEPSGGHAFATKGTTLFRWTERLDLTEPVEGRFEIVMAGDVECLHRDIASRGSTLTGERLAATFARRPAEAGAAAPPPGPSIAFGGSLEPKRLVGSGSIFVRTPERDVTCDEFDYNPSTGIASLGSLPGRTVSVLTAKAARPFRAERVVWNMNPGIDTITVMRGASAGAP